jgi:hypothetical protein
VPQEGEVQSTECDEYQAALYPSGPVGRLASDYVIRAVTKEEGKEQIKFSRKDGCNQESC